MTIDVESVPAGEVAAPPTGRLNLVRAEFQRLLSRRFVQILTVLMVGVFALTIGVTMASSHQPSPAEWVAAEQQAQTNNELSRQVYDECVAAHRPDASAFDRARYPVACKLIVSEPEDFLYGTYVFKSSIELLVGFLTAYLALFGFLVGATFIGAELSSGGATNLLLWRPQRMRVLGAKLGVLLAAIGAFATVFSAVYVATFYGIARASGYVGSIDSQFVSHLALLVARGLALALAVTAISFAVATIGRHTAAALGLLTGYVVVWEGGARLIMEILDARMPEPWFLSTYVGAWMVGKLEFYDYYSSCYSDVGGGCTGHYYVYWWHGALVLGALLALFVGGAFALFRRRDLT
jgi:ABC-2 type transport system permease protein